MSEAPDRWEDYFADDEKKRLFGILLAASRVVEVGGVHYRVVSNAGMLAKSAGYLEGCPRDWFADELFMYSLQPSFRFVSILFESRGEAKVFLNNTNRDLLKIQIGQKAFQKEFLGNMRSAVCRPSKKSGFSVFVGRSGVVKELLREVEEVAKTPFSVMLRGATGTGKEILARICHEKSLRAGGPFVPVNCASIPDGLLESELFGFERGAFTDARREKPGYFEIADQGTIFLDEIGELPLHLQVKLLRIMEQQEVWRLGAVKPRKIDVRIVAATNRDLCKMLNAGVFRGDLYYRFDYDIFVPSLSQRGDDVLDIAESIVQDLKSELGCGVSLGESAHEALRRYQWPGNVRELRRVLRKAVFLARGKAIVTSEDLLFDGDKSGEDKSNSNAAIIKPLRDLEKEAILACWEKTGGNSVVSASLLEISYRTFRNKLRKYGLK